MFCLADTQIKNKFLKRKRGTTIFVDFIVDYILINYQLSFQMHYPSNQNGKKLYERILANQPEVSDLFFQQKGKTSHERQPLSDLEDNVVPSIQYKRTILLGESPTKYNQSYLDSKKIQHLAQKIKKSFAADQDANIRVSSNKKKSRYSDSSQLTRMFNDKENLYEKGLRLQSQKEKWIERQSQCRAKKQVQQCTHQPKINKSPSFVLQNMSQKTVYQTKNELIQQYKLQQQEKLKNVLIFQPKITKIKDLQKSKQQSKVSSGDVFTNLHSYHKVQQSNRNRKILNNLSESQFKPKINELSKQIVKNTSFNQRMERYSQQKQKKIQSARKALEIQNIHKPQINKNTKRDRNNQTIGEFLYSQHRKINQKEQKNQKPVINQKSKEIYERKKYFAFQKIFQDLDVYNNGSLCFRELSIKNVNQKVFQIIFPVLEEAQFMEIQLSHEQFIEALNILFNDLNPQQRKLLIDYPTQQFKNQKYQSVNKVNPKINKKSQQLVESMDRSIMNIYDYCSVKQHIKNQNIESQKVQKQKKQMKECTFTPQILKPNSYY